MWFCEVCIYIVGIEDVHALQASIRWSRGNEHASTGLTKRRKIVAVIPKSDKDCELYCMATVCMPNSNVGPQEAKEGEPWLPPGFRFHPTDEELVSYYLTKKVVDSNFAVHAIAEVDLNKCEPWDLPGVHLGLFVQRSTRTFRCQGPWAVKYYIGDLLRV